MTPPPIEVLITVDLNNEQLTRLRGVSPRINLTALPNARTSDIPAETWARTEVLYTAYTLPEPQQAPALKWVQFHFAGIDRFLDEPLLKRNDLLVTTLSGAAATQVAEYVLAMLLALSHKLPGLLAAQKKAEWPKDRFERFNPVELRGKTAAIVGYGSIGRQVARLLQPFGVKILASKRDAMHPSDKGYTPEDMGDPGGDLVNRLYPAQALRSMVKAADFIIVTVPLTHNTVNLIDERILAAAHPGAFLVDVSRGSVVDQTALINALKNGKLAGAALDVFPEEPLPSSSPLWQIPNLIVTPHIAGGSPHYTERAVELFSENLYRYLAGLTLYNLFDLQRGY